MHKLMQHERDYSFQWTCWISSWIALKDSFANLIWVNNWFTGPVSVSLHIWLRISQEPRCLQSSSACTTDGEIYWTELNQHNETIISLYSRIWMSFIFDEVASLILLMLWNNFYWIKCYKRTSSSTTGLNQWSEFGGGTIFLTGQWQMEGVFGETCLFIEQCIVGYLV